MATIDASKMDKKVYDANGKLISSEKAKDDGTEQGINFRWWKAPDESIAAQVMGTVAFMQKHQGSRLEQLQVSTRLYGNTSAFSLMGVGFTRANSVNSNPQSQRISFNLCSSVIDTLTARVAKNKVLPTFLTEKGIWGTQQKAKQLSQFVEGMFYQSDMHTKGVYAFRDAGVWGDGIVKIWRDGDEIRVTRAYPHNIVVDVVESYVTNPSQLHEVHVVDRDVAIDMYPDKEAEIRMILPASYQDIGGVGTAADLVTLIESWHLPSGKDADDGLHVITCGDKLIFTEKYTKDYFPFVKISYTERVLGWWGQSACERLQNLQGEINRLMILIQRSMWMGGSFKVLVENGSKVVSQHLNNDVGAIIHYSGTRPEYITPPMIQQDIYPYVDALIDKGFRQEGVSQMSAGSMKPAGLDSGKALREYNDIEADRFLFLGQNMEKFYLEAGRQMIEVGKDIYKDKHTFKISFATSRFMETVDWKDIKLKEDEYVMKAYPTSSLAKDFSGRLSDVQEGMQAGLISPRLGKRLMNFPDVEMADTLSSAPEELLHKVLEDIIYNDKYMAPEPTMDLTLAQQLYVEYYNYCQYMEAPPEVLAGLLKWKTQLDDLTGVAQPQVAAGAVTGAAPQAVAAPPPVSNMVPNVSGMAGAPTQ